MHRESGQATVEWVAAVALVAIALGAAAHVGEGFDGRSLGGLLAHRIACAAARCDGEDRALERAYGARTARLVRDHAPGLVFEPGERQLPVDWRLCRTTECAEAPDDRELDAHRTDAGQRTTLFTRVRREGPHLYIQYWAYYPTSLTAVAGSDELWRRSPIAQAVGLVVNGSTGYPGYHRDDWEAVAVRIERRSGRVSTRVTSHGRWQWCKHARCEGRWGEAGGWARVSKGSHAGHVPVTGSRHGLGEPAVPGVDLVERTTTADGVTLIPIETLGRRGYRRLDPSIAPPWSKEAYRDPEADAS